MMKNFLLILLGLLLSFYVNAQNIQVEYWVEQNANEDIRSTNIKYTLLIKGNQSLYLNNKKDSINQFKYKDYITEVVTDNGITSVKLSDNHYALLREDLFYKNYEKDTLIYNEIIVSKKITLGESITKLFDWTIIPDTDTTILNYKCQKAEAKFRGRKYVAYFSSELAEFGGPWKFDGLPGLILYVYSKDNYFVLKPLKIALNSSLEDIENPYKNEEDILSWNDYVKGTTKRYKKMLKKLKALSSSGEDGSIGKADRIEDLGISKMSFKK